jgi:hypothetical protein
MYGVVADFTARFSDAVHYNDLPRQMQVLVSQEYEETYRRLNDHLENEIRRVCSPPAANNGDDGDGGALAGAVTVALGVVGIIARVVWVLL